MSNDTVTLRVPLFKPGQAVLHQGRQENVSHVLLRRGELLVFLQGFNEPLLPEQLSLEPTEIVYRKR